MRHMVLFSYMETCVFTQPEVYFNENIINMQVILFSDAQKLPNGPRTCNLLQTFVHTLCPHPTPKRITSKNHIGSSIKLLEKVLSKKMFARLRFNRHAIPAERRFGVDVNEFKDFLLAQTFLLKMSEIKDIQMKVDAITHNLLRSISQRKNRQTFGRCR